VEAFFGDAATQFPVAEDDRAGVIETDIPE